MTWHQYCALYRNTVLLVGPTDRMVTCRNALLVCRVFFGPVFSFFLHNSCQYIPQLTMHVQSEWFLWCTDCTFVTLLTNVSQTKCRPLILHINFFTRPVHMENTAMSTNIPQLLYNRAVTDYILWLRWHHLQKHSESIWHWSLDFGGGSHNFPRRLINTISELQLTHLI